MSRSLRNCGSAQKPIVEGSGILKRVLITGITGFVGSHLAEYCLAQGAEVFGTYRWRSPLDNISEIVDKITLIECDLLDEKSTFAAIETAKPDYIFHLAAQSYVPFSYTGPTITIQTNMIGTLNILESVRRYEGDPIVHVCSSSEVYGQVEADEVPISEKNPLRPLSPYAVSKVGADLMAFQYFSAHAVKTVRTRAFTHSGPKRGRVFAASAFAKQIAEIEVGKQEPVLRVGNLDSVRTWMDVRDVCRAYWLCVEKGTPGEVYNIGGNDTRTIREVLDYLLSISTVADKVKVEIAANLLRPSDVTLQIPDVAKFKAATGWEPEIPFETTMQDLLDYWRQITK